MGRGLGKRDAVLTIVMDCIMVLVQLKTCLTLEMFTATTLLSLTKNLSHNASPRLLHDGGTMLRIYRIYCAKGGGDGHSLKDDVIKLHYQSRRSVVVSYPDPTCRGCF